MKRSEVRSLEVGDCLAYENGVMQFTGQVEMINRDNVLVNWTAFKSRDILSRTSPIWQQVRML